jgi:GDP-L-fucose synthase
MRTLVTGASGFLGTKLCAALARAGHEVTAVSSTTHDLRNSTVLDKLTEPYETIYHLAAWTQAGDFCLKHPGEQWLNNQMINTTVLSWWSRLQPQAKMISMGTSCAYDPALPLKEENYLVGAPIDGLYTYAMTKRMLHIGQVSLNRQYGLKYLTLVPSTLYGSGYHTDGRQMHFIFDLIRKILKAKKDGEPPVLWGDGYQRRELVHADDFIAIALDLSTRCENEAINIGAGEEFSIRHFAEEICRDVDYPFDKIVFDTSRYVGATSKCLDTKKLGSLCPSLELTPLRTGLREVVDWFSVNRNILI